MRNTAILVILGVLSLARSTGIKHIIVLMLENRSFDHMLGFLKKTNPNIKGCLPGEAGCSNNVVANDATSASVTVNDEAVYVQDSPQHSIHSTTFQIYGSSQMNDHPSMSGFIESYQRVLANSSETGSSIMRCFAPEHVPIMSTLAQEFAIIDGWHASVPGPTMVNRAYAASGTSDGMGVNDPVTIAKGMPQETMFRQLQRMGLDYRVYWSDLPAVMMFKDVRHRDARPKFKLLDKFFDDVAAGDLPDFTWIEPAYYNTPFWVATDQHPDHDVGYGEKLIKDVYEALRNSPIWEDSALIITYDEHGGFFDHVPPSQTNVPNPDGKNATDDPFDFTRIGVRIPTLVVSPRVAKGTLVHGYEEVGASQFEHSSTIATVVHKLFHPKAGHQAPQYLTKRVEWARTFEGVFDLIKPPRKDCPTVLPEPFMQRAFAPSSFSTKGDGHNVPNDLQLDLLAVALGLAMENQAYSEEAFLTKLESMRASMTEAQMGEFCRRTISEYLDQTEA
jgi:phospholipase C